MFDQPLRRRYSNGMSNDEIKLTPGDGGWVQARFKARDLSKQQTVYVRFAPDDTRWRAVELWLRDPSPKVLRALPLTRIEHAVNARESGQIAFGLAAGHENPTPADLPAHFKDKRRRIVQPFKLERPAGRRLDDSFYERVAFAYRQAVARGSKPRRAIADAAGVTTDVAGRWIYEARKRDFIPKTSPGKLPDVWEADDD
jgi:hypothetical protein